MELLRAALRKYGELISQYPTSDKIDDAAYKMARIHEGFGDYTIALAFYQRAYQWDAATPLSGQIPGRGHPRQETAPPGRGPGGLPGSHRQGGTIQGPAAHGRKTGPGIEHLQGCPK